MPSRDYKKDNFIARVFKSQIFFTLLALALLVMILIPVYKNQQDRRAIDREIAEIEKKMKEYENSNEELIEMFDYLESDESAMKQARINFNYKKPGEEVVVIKTEIEEQNNIVNNTNNIKEELSNPKIWFRYFFN
ncbi:MAG TPA: septum formation initiator family protein [Patescibacteria group bacterium]|nr:septum formation initiator family protein [Patescibacteria group bacterium]